MKKTLTNVLWGLFFIIIGIGFLGEALDLWNFELFFPGWWTLFIIIPCFIGMIQSGFGAGSTLGFIIGVLLLVSHWYDFDINLFALIVPVILIYIGIRIIFRDVFRKKIHINHTTFTNNSGGQTEFNHASDGKTEYSAIFSSNKIHIEDNNFYGAELNAIFGGIVLDLRDINLDHDIELNANAIFGGVEIFVPRGIRVKTNNIPIFGGVSNKTSEYFDPNAATIYLNSTCMFGGIDIK